MSDNLALRIKKEHEDFVQLNIKNNSLQFYKDVLDEVRNEYFNPKFCDKDIYLWRVKNGYYSAYNHFDDVRQTFWFSEIVPSNTYLQEVVDLLKLDGFEVKLFKTSFYVSIPGVK